jgi:hypothetical protein
MRYLFGVSDTVNMAFLEAEVAELRSGAHNGASFGVMRSAIIEALLYWAN